MNDTNEESNMRSAQGFLAIWSDISKEVETDFLHWFIREHAAERMGIPGFLGVRLFRATDNKFRRYFILYQLTQADVVASAPYLARLNALTEWSRRIIASITNGTRGQGRIVAHVGLGKGRLVLPVFFAAGNIVTARAALASLATLDRVVAATLYEANSIRTPIHATESARVIGKRSFGAFLLVEALDQTGLDCSSELLGGLLPGFDRVALCYHQIFALDHEEVV